MTRYYKYYSALFRVRNHEYCYLDKVTGQWIHDAAVCDRVHREAAIKDLTPDQAKAWVARLYRLRVRLCHE